MSIPPRDYARKAILYALFMLVLVPTALAIPVPRVEIIPDAISANGTFIMNVDMGSASDEPVFVWYEVQGIVGIEDIFIGSLPKMGTNWTCIFSNDGDVSTCGPTPYAMSFDKYYQGPTSDPPTSEDCEKDFIQYGCFFIEAVGMNGRYPEPYYKNVTFVVPVGEIQINPQITIGTNNVSLLVETPLILSTVEYAVYHKNLTLFQDYKTMNRNAQGLHISEFGIIPGDFYVAFRATATGNQFGGTVANLSIPRSAAYQDICPGVSEQDGGIITIEPVVWNPIINKSLHAEKKNLRITNHGDSDISNLSVKVPGSIEDYISIELDSNNLSAQSYIYFTVAIDDIEEPTSFNTLVPLVTTDDLGEETEVAQIPLRISVSVRDACEGMGLIQAPESVIELDSYAWQETLLTGTSVPKEFRIKNNGDEDLTDFEYVATASLTNLIEDISMPSRIEPGKTATMTITVKGSRSKSYYGTVAIKTNVGSEMILVGLSFTEDISGSLDSLEYQVDELGEELEIAPDEVQELISDIKDLIMFARSDVDSGDYDAALEKYTEADFKFSALKDVATVVVSGTAPPGGGDGTIVVIIILVIVIVGAAAFGAWYYFTKLKKGEGLFGGEEEKEGGGIENEDELDF